MRWLALALLALLSACYAIPAQHDVNPQPSTEAGTDPDTGQEADAALDGGEVERDSEAPADTGAGMDAQLDAGDAEIEAGQEAGAVDAGPEAEASACGTCSADRPECLAATGTCVACLADDAGACVGKLCSASYTCIECRENKDCKNPAASLCNVGSGTCVACNEGNDSQCSHISGKGVCATGQCVQCRRDKASACFAEGTQFVCDPTTRSCDFDRKAHSKTLCNACVSGSDTGCKAKADCVSDDECQAGQACVDVPAGAGVKVCQQVKTASACPRPYVGVTPSARPSADGPSVQVCTFRTLTTCRAHADFSKQRCGTPKDGGAEDQPGSADHTKCGVPGLDDGYCAFASGFNQYRCTVPCNNLDDDCPASGGSCDTAVTPNLCTFQ
jgi:hypothetical protein